MHTKGLARSYKDLLQKEAGLTKLNPNIRIKIKGKIERKDKKTLAIL